jgi:hypothetical protein
MSHANTGKITAASGMVTEDYLVRHTLKRKGAKLATASDNPLLPKNRDACFGDYPEGARGSLRETKPMLLKYLSPKATPVKAPCSPRITKSNATWEKGTIAILNSKWDGFC